MYLLRTGNAIRSATALKLTASMNVHGAFPKIYRWSSMSHLRERTLRLKGKNASWFWGGIAVYFTVVRMSTAKFP
ncbi:MAG: hypothetical protein EWV60_20020 [Microcystis sp. Msp_OC_L_20101000_S702]|nr:MAG: hypothetical protein EWV60_20020 [Microcystis sp. Msp_OC_L_20101000_S702]